MSFARPITRAPDQSTTLRVARSRAKRSAADWQGAHRVFLFLLTGAASTLPVSRLGSGPMVSMTAGWMLFPLPRGSLNPCVRGRDSATAQGRAGPAEAHIAKVLPTPGVMIDASIADRSAPEVLERRNRLAFRASLLVQSVLREGGAQEVSNLPV
jgi:hypothetical protein